MVPPKNVRGRPVTKLCLALETFRRTDDGRVRDAAAFLGHFFPRDPDGARDRLFVHMPAEIRAPLLSGWGIRGKRSALRDTDAKVRETVCDALDAGDVDAPVIEAGVTPEILIDWVPLEDWWAFWRGTTLPIGCVRSALALARELSLFDERWFLEHLRLTSQRLEGTDVVCAALPKEQVVAWMRAIHTSGDASPTGLVTALGWETVLAKTARDALTYALDALARQIGLADGAAERRSDAPRSISLPPEATRAEAPNSLTAPRPMESRKSASVPVASKPPPLPPAAKVASPVIAVVLAKPTAAAAAPALAPVSSPPTARALFGAPPELPPMRPPAATLSGVGGPLLDGAMPPAFGIARVEEVEVRPSHEPGEEPAWAPPRAEPGDMGWDLAYGVKRPMPNDVQPRYGLAEGDDEPTSELALTGDDRLPRP